jgi:hypothetical protein
MEEWGQENMKLQKWYMINPQEGWSHNGDDDEMWI